MHSYQRTQSAVIIWIRFAIIMAASLKLVHATGYDNTPSQQPCIVDGTVDVYDKWFGFIANMSLEAGQGFRYVFTYPYRKQVQNVILYEQYEVQMLTASQSCWQKEGIIRGHGGASRIMDLSYRSSWNGCVTQSSLTDQLLVCSGERRFEDPEEVYLALSNCRARSGLYLKFRLERIGDERCN